MRLMDTLSHGQSLEDASKFRKLFPKEIYELLTNISREGFCLTLVGGAVRDWLMTSDLSTDLDFEIHHTFSYSPEEWALRLKRLGERLRDVYHVNVEFLSFSIMRVSWEGLPYDVELAPARIEKYPKEERSYKKSSLGHRDFKVSLLSNAPYSETFKRRDFTINALGIEFHSPETKDEFIFIDPFKGLEDLKNKILTPCSDDFPKDPVRFCRALRFAQKYNLSYSDQLKESFSLFNLTQLSHFYFFKEGLKGDFFKFAQSFFSLCEEYSIALSQELLTLEFLKTCEGTAIPLRNVDQVLLALIYKEKRKEEELVSFSSVARVRKGLLSGHLNFKENLKELEGEELIRGQSPQDFCQHPLSERLLKFNQFMSKNSPDKLAIIGRFDSHLYEIFTGWLKKVPAQLEGKELFEALQDKLSLKERGKLLIYCHLKETKQI